MSHVNMPNGIPAHVNGVDSSHSSRDSSPSTRMMQQPHQPPTIPQSQLPPVRQLTQNFANLQVKQATPSTSPKPFSTSTPVLNDLNPAPNSADVSPINAQAQLASRINNTNVPSSLNRPVSQPRLVGYSSLQNQFNQNLMGGGSSVGSNQNSRGSSVNASPVRAQQTDSKPPSLINGAQGDFNKFARPPLNKQMTLPQQLTGHQLSDGVNKTNSLDSVHPYGSLQQTGVGSSQNLRSLDNLQPGQGFNQQVSNPQAPGMQQQVPPGIQQQVPPGIPNPQQFSKNLPQPSSQYTGAVNQGLPTGSQNQPNFQSRGVNQTLLQNQTQNQRNQTDSQKNQAGVESSFQSQTGGVNNMGHQQTIGQNLHPASVAQRPNTQQGAFPLIPTGVAYHTPTSLHSASVNQNQSMQYANQNPGLPQPVQGYNKNFPGAQFPPAKTGDGQGRPVSAGQLGHMSMGYNQAKTGQLPPSNVGFPGSVPPSNIGQAPAGQLPPTSNIGAPAGSIGHLPPTSNIGAPAGSIGHLPPTSNIGASAGIGQLPPSSNFGQASTSNIPSNMGQFPPKSALEGQARTNLHANRYPTQQLNPLQQSQMNPVQQPQLNPVHQPQLNPVQQPQLNTLQQQQQQQQQPRYQPQTGYQQPYQQTQYQSNYSQKPQNLNQNFNYNQPNIPQMGFNKLWGTESYDLLQTPVILPRGKVETPRVTLGNELLDNANCHPDIFRCTMTKIPESNSLLQKSRLPLGVLIHPFRDLNQLPVIQCNTIVRCRACRTYINPFVFFVDNKRWKCNLCYRVNELPEEFQYDPVTKTYGDPSRRPEVKASTIEYIAPAEYMLRPPQPAVYLFLLDVSRAAVESGYLSTVCSVLSAELSTLPGDARTHIGFIAYNSALHFYSLADGLSQPHEMTVLDVDEIFLPCPDNLLVNLQDRMELVGDLLAQLPCRFNQSYDNGSALGAALQAAHKMMSSTGGRVTVFQCTLPNVGPGLLSPREDPSQRAGSEAQHLNPANDFYKRLALECSGQQIAVDLFILNSQYVDIATISGISRFSGGCMHHYPLFKASRVMQNESFERALRRYLTRKIGFEAVMRIRCSRGLSIHTFHGNFFVRSTDLLSLPNVNPDAGFGMQVAIEENLSDVQTVCFQAALLYTSSKGERRIRVHTMCLPIANNVSDVINSADQQCIIGLLAKMAVDRSMQSSLSDAREAFINVAIDILSSYKLIQNMGPTSSLMAPSCLRLLPLYISALLKNQAFRTGVSTRLDDRVKAMCDMKTRPLTYLIQSIYPDLYPIHNLHEQTTILNEEEEPVPNPPHLHLTARSIDSNGAYLMDTGDHMIIIVCPAVNQTFLNQALGVPDYNSITDQMHELPILDNEHNQRLHMFVNYLNDEKPFKATLQVLRDNSQLRMAFLERLVEDRVETALSYHEFLQHLKTQVK